MILKHMIGALAFLLLTTISAAADAMEPMATIKTPVDSVIVILNDPKYKGTGTKSAQRDEIWKVVKPMF
ncbi:MAG: hypothetical protein V2I40_10870, partial [Desulfobacteraceae bacterium]|nr:hypothetical protein [Desulfobacteraceae bacterium]